MAASDKRKTVITVDPEMWMDRELYLREKHSGWAIFKSIYWSMYLLVVGGFLLYYTSTNISIEVIAGISLILLAVMIIVYGFAEALHFKFIKRYG